MRAQWAFLDMRAQACGGVCVCVCVWACARVRVYVCLGFPECSSHLRTVLAHEDVCSDPRPCVRMVAEMPRLTPLLGLQGDMVIASTKARFLWPVKGAVNKTPVGSSIK